jgi:hypothetical protein
VRLNLRGIKNERKVYMIITVGESLEKICPLKKSNCCGDDCMLWNWFDGEVKGGNITVKNKKRRGFCGLSCEENIDKVIL